MRYIVFCVLFSTVFSSAAQQGKIIGKIRDEKNEAIIGASIIYKKEVTIGAISNEKGGYFLEVPAGETQLICRYIGMVTDTFQVVVRPNETLVFDIILVESTNLPFA